MKAEHLNIWLMDATREKYSDTEKCDKLASITKVAFQYGYILEALTWTTMVLIPKGGGEYIRIGLVEVIWKVFTSIVNSRLRSTIILQDALHGFRQGRGTGTAIMEAKIEHKLAGISHEPLFQVFIDVRKAYGSLCKGRCMKILRGYGLGPKLHRLLHRYWYRHKVVLEAGTFFGRPLNTKRGVTQVDLVSPMIFNIVVYAVAMEVLLGSADSQESQHRFV